MAGIDIPRWMWALADDYPFAQPPEGVVPNFEHPQLVGYHSLTIACSVCIALILLFSATRLYAKIWILRKTSLDDYIFWIALPMLLIVLCLHIYLDNNGAYGYHAWDVKVRVLTKPLLVVTFLHQVFLPPTIWLVKATLMCLILGAFKPVRWLRMLCWFGIITTFIFYTVNFAIQIALCQPRGGTDRISFLAGMATPKCAGSTAAIQKLSLASGAFGVISDIYILIIPLPSVATLNIMKRKKVGLYIIFSSGVLACIASILSLSFRIHSYGTNDLTVDSIPNMTAQIVELSVGLIITCIAPVSIFARHVIDKHFPSLLRGSTYQSSPNMAGQIPIKPSKKHFPGGLSELDSMRTFGTTVDAKMKSSSSTVALQAPAP